MSTVTVRRAVAADLAAIVGLLADDPLGASREDASLPLDGRYIAAFAAIEADPNQSLVVAEAGRSIVGCLQVTFIPGVSRKGTWRGPSPPSVAVGSSISRGRPTSAVADRR